MRLRTLRIWKRWKPLWLLLIGWGVFSILLLLLWGYSLLDWHGGLPDADILNSQTITEKNVKKVIVQAEGVKLEVGSSYDIKTIKTQLYGTGYINQRVVWNLEDDGTLYISLAEYPITANAYGDMYQDNLILRVLLPKKDYDMLQFSGNRVQLVLKQCTAKQLIAKIRNGSMVVRNVSAQKASFYSNTSNLDLQRNKIHYLTIDNEEGNTIVSDNELQYWKYYSLNGNLNLWAKTIKGIWELNSRWGDIHVGIRKQNHNLFMSLHSEETDIVVTSRKKKWQKRIAETLDKDTYELLEGGGKNMLLVTTKSGKIILNDEKREMKDE